MKKNQDVPEQLRLLTEKNRKLYSWDLFLGMCLCSIFIPGFFLAQFEINGEQKEKINHRVR